MMNPGGGGGGGGGGGHRHQGPRHKHPGMGMRHHRGGGGVDKMRGHPRPQHHQQRPLGIRAGGQGQQQQKPHQPMPGPSAGQQQQMQQQQQRPSSPQQPAPFHKAASNVLVQVSEFVKQRGQNPNKPWNRVKVKELQKLIDQDLFCLAADWRSSRLNPLQHFRLLGIVCTYFQKEVAKETDPQLCYLHFDIIFCGREGEALLHDARVQFLVKLCSLATQFPVYNIFELVAHWLSKVASDDLKRSYAEQIVAELIDGFLLTPPENRMHEFLLPLVDHSFDFCANFVVFSIAEHTLGPVLAQLLGDWLAPRVDLFLRALSQASHLGQPFCAQKFDLLLRYDCSPEAADQTSDKAAEEYGHRLHFVLIEIASRWRTGFESSQQKRPSLPAAASPQQQHHQAPILSQPIVNSLQEAFQNFDTLPPLAQSRVLEHMNCCIRAGFLPSLEPFRGRFITGLKPSELAGPNGQLWQCLALLVRGQ